MNAQEKLIENTAQAIMLIDKIKGELKNNLNSAPINWGHSGTAAKVLEDLKEIANFLNIKP